MECGGWIVDGDEKKNFRNACPAPGGGNTLSAPLWPNGWDPASPDSLFLSLRRLKGF